MKNNLQTAIFGGGCFWCTEAIFKSLKGVESVTPGYAGGTKENPTYEEVSSGATGHAEVTRIKFNSKIIPYKVLLDVFWHTHDPTTPNRQGADVGEQYRSIILYTSEAQKQEAQKMLEKLKQSGEFKNPIITEIKPLEKFYEAENYHRDYFANHKNAPYCQLVISPKLKHLRETYSSLLS